MTGKPRAPVPFGSYEVLLAATLPPACFAPPSSSHPFFPATPLVRVRQQVGRSKKPVNQKPTAAFKDGMVKGLTLEPQGDPGAYDPYNNSDLIASASFSFGFTLYTSLPYKPPCMPSYAKPPQSLRHAPVPPTSRPWSSSCL